jgi:hypothetical protein
MKTVTEIGLDIAKPVFQVYGAPAQRATRSFVGGFGARMS